MSNVRKEDKYTLGYFVFKLNFGYFMLLCFQVKPWQTVSCRLQVSASDGNVSGTAELVPIRPVATLMADLELKVGELYQLL